VQLAVDRLGGARPSDEEREDGPAVRRPAEALGERARQPAPGEAVAYAVGDRSAGPGRARAAPEGDSLAAPRPALEQGEDSLRVPGGLLPRVLGVVGLPPRLAGRPRGELPLEDLLGGEAERADEDLAAAEDVATLPPGRRNRRFGFSSARRRRARV
jgi:hypothetical protein